MEEPKQSSEHSLLYSQHIKLYKRYKEKIKIKTKKTVNLAERIERINNCLEFMSIEKDRFEKLSLTD